MVKIAEKDKRRSPLAAVYGLLLAAGLFAIAYVIASEVIIKKFANVRDVLASMGKLQGTLAVAFIVWIVLLAAAYFVVAILAGKDPNSGKEIPLPPKQKDLKKKKK